MKQIILSTAFAMLWSLSLFAQKTPPPPDAKRTTQNIMIRKSGSDKEKTTIVIDGDRITVNGKPLNEYKGDIKISENTNTDFDMLPPLPPAAPLYPHGGAKSFSRSFNISGNKAFLGVYTDDDDAGAKIKSVTKDSPADKAGMKEDDIITKVDTDNIENAGDLMDAVGKYKPEDKVTLTYLRDKKENTIKVTLDKNKEPGFAWSSGDKDFMKTFRNLSLKLDDNKARLGIHIEDTETGTGVKITDIEDEDTPGAKAGLKEDDIITQINGKKVSSVKEARDILSDIKPGDTVSLSYQRKGNAQTATAHIPKPLEDSDL